MTKIRWRSFVVCLQRNSREVQVALLDERVDHIVHDGHHDQDQDGVDGLVEEGSISSSMRHVRKTPPQK